MNLSEIETFLTIVSTGSITRTADLLFLSQPTVSHRLRSLEEELQFPLADCTGICRKRAEPYPEVIHKQN